jgi:hypothetical protein
MLKKEYIYLCIMISLLTKCIEIQQPLEEIINKEKKYSKLFSTCKNTDGRFLLKVSQQQQTFLKGYLDWASYKNNHFQLSLSPPIGDEIISLQYKDNQIKLKGIKSEHYKSLSVDADGYLKFKNHWIGIKADELPCFLAGKLPQKWLSLPTNISEKTSPHINLYDAKRIITIIPERKSRNYTVEIKWNTFWFLSQAKIIIISKYNKQRTLSININNKINFNMLSFE